jgi:hypothetical protein
MLGFDAQVLLHHRGMAGGIAGHGAQVYRISGHLRSLTQDPLLYRMLVDAEKNP